MKYLFLLLFSLPSLASVEGVWTLTEARDLNEAGEWVHPFGVKPSGMFVYSGNGMASVQIPGYVGYIGQYVVTDTEIIHSVESAWDRTMVNTLQTRPYVMQGEDMMILGDKKTWIRVLKRLRPARTNDMKGRICTKWEIRG